MLKWICFILVIVMILTGLWDDWNNRNNGFKPN